VARVGSQWASPVIGHFGTFNPLVTAVLAPAIVHVLEARPDAIWLLIGRDGERFAADLARQTPYLADRIVATGTVSADSLSAHVLAADVFVQPYPDGVTARRTTATALLGHGRVIVTTDGHLTESFWRTDAGVCLVPAGDAAGLARAAIHLLDDAAARTHLAEAAARMFVRRFSGADAIMALQAAV
jgi:glycosyltransferase involved in cell wall biosynthesis